MAFTSQHDRLLPPLWIIALGLAALLLWLLFALKEIVVLLVVGYSIAYVIDPLLVRLERRQISRGVGVIVIAGLCLVVALILAQTAVPTIVRNYDKLATNLPEYVAISKEKLQPFIERAKKYLPGEKSEEVKPELPVTKLPQVSSTTLDSVLGAIVGTLLRGYSITLTLINLLLLPFIVFYLAVDFPHMHRGALELIPISYRRKVLIIAREINGYVSAFIRGQLTVCCITFLLYAIGLGLVGIELWFLLAVIAGFGNMVPYVGFLSGIVLSSIMALVTFGDFTHLLQVWGVFAVVNALDGMLITPRIIGERVGLSPLVVILAIFAGGKIFGLLGIFLAVPVAAALRVLMKYSHGWVVAR